MTSLQFSVTSLQLRDMDTKHLSALLLDSALRCPEDRNSHHHKCSARECSSGFALTMDNGLPGLVISRLDRYCYKVCAAGVTAALSGTLRQSFFCMCCGHSIDKQICGCVTAQASRAFKTSSVPVIARFNATCEFARRASPFGCPV